LAIENIKDFHYFFPAFIVLKIQAKGKAKSSTVVSANILDRKKFEGTPGRKEGYGKAGLL